MTATPRSLLAPLLSIWLAVPCAVGAQLSAGSDGASADAQQAVQDATARLAKDPNDLQALVDRAKAYIALGQAQLAERDAREATKLDPMNSAAWLSLAAAQLKENKRDKALTSEEDVITLTDGNAPPAGSDMADLERAARQAAAPPPRAAAAPPAAAPMAPQEQSSGPPLWMFVAALGVVVIGAMAYLAFRTDLLGLGTLAKGPAKGGLAAKYELRRVVGRGGMGDVHEAVDRSLGRLVAIKRMSEAVTALGPQGREFFLKEARFAAAVHHPAIVDVYEILEDGPELYLVFEFVSGRTVAELLVETPRLPLPRVLDILRPVCEALDFAHSRGLVHRDLKPANIMVSDQGFVKLMDFGIARSLFDASPVGSTPVAAPAGPIVARTATIAGTPSYMALEAENGVVRKESDIYSLGVCAYEMMTGLLPYAPGAPLKDKAEEKFRRPSEIVGAPKAVDELLLRALSTEPEKRPASAREFLAALERAAAASS